jgi:hypothetical protein
VRRIQVPEPDLRADLADKFREQAHKVADRLGGGVAPDGHALERADALDAGESVTVANWELPKGTLPLGSCRPGRPYWYVVEPDGSIHLSEASANG